MGQDGVDWIEGRMGTSGLGVDGVERVGDEQAVAGVLYVSQDKMGRGIDR